MNSLDKLLTNTTNRFQSLKSASLSQFNSNFTPILNPQQLIISSQSQYHPLLHLILDIQVPQSYEELQKREKELLKNIQDAKQEKSVMKALFDKLLLVEQGKQQRLKKRFRRKKNEIQGKYACDCCDKVYSSSTSLARHAKLKHPYSMMQPPQRDYHIPPQPNSMNSSTSEEEKVESREGAIEGVKRAKVCDESVDDDQEIVEASDEGEESQEESLFSEQLS